MLLLKDLASSSSSRRHVDYKFSVFRGLCPNCIIYGYILVIYSKTVIYQFLRNNNELICIIFTTLLVVINESFTYPKILNLFNLKFHFRNSGIEFFLNTFVIKLFTSLSLNSDFLSVGLEKLSTFKSGPFYCRYPKTFNTVIIHSSLQFAICFRREKAFKKVITEMENLF